MTEYFYLVDEDDKVIGKASRQECHSNPKLIHRSTAVFVFNSKGELFLQKRSAKKDLDPGLWDVSASGHVAYGETYEQAAVREVKEELGIKTDLKDLLFLKYSVKQESENSKIFIANHNGPFKLNREEISEGGFFKLQELKNMPSLSPYCLAVLGEYFKLKK